MIKHVHLLATSKTEESVPKVLQPLGHRYVQDFNHTDQRTGTL
jgi:hypothetical protein